MQSKVSRRQGAVSFVFVIVLSKMNYVQKSVQAPMFRLTSTARDGFFALKEVRALGQND